MTLNDYNSVLRAMTEAFQISQKQASERALNEVEAMRSLARQSDVSFALEEHLDSLVTALKSLFVE